MTPEDRAAIVETFGELHARAMRDFSEHLLRNFRGEVDVLSGKVDRLRERLEQLERSAVENAPTTTEGRR